jgi:signal peptidase I
VKSFSNWAKEAFTPGKGIALVVGCTLVFFVWGMVFEPNGSGSNVVLGLLVALVGIYLVVSNLGPTLDGLFFHGGSRERMLLLRHASEILSEVEAVTLPPDKDDGEKKKRAAFDAAIAALKKMSEELESAAAPKDDGTEDETLTKQVTLLKDAIADVSKAAEDRYGGLPRRSWMATLRPLAGAFAVALVLRAFVIEPFQIPSGSMIPTLLVGDHLFVAKFWYGLAKPLANPPSYMVRWSDPEPGDVVVFEAPPYVGINAGQAWIKRVIAGPGQKVFMKNTVMHVDGKPYAHVGSGERVTYLDYHEEFRSWSEDTAISQREKVPAREHEVYLGFSRNQSWPNGADPRSCINRGGCDGLTCTEDECTVNEGHIFVMGDNRDNSSDGRIWGAVPIDNVKGRALFIWMSVDGSQRSLELGRFTLPRFRWDRWFDGIQ